MHSHLFPLIPIPVPIPAVLNSTPYNLTLRLILLWAQLSCFGGEWCQNGRSNCEKWANILRRAGQKLQFEAIKLGQKTKDW